MKPLQFDHEYNFCLGLTFYASDKKDEYQHRAGIYPNLSTACLRYIQEEYE